MKVPPHIIDEIKSRLPCSTVVGRYVQLKKAGREYRGLSPFQAEKTPSFYVNDQKATWFDFSSGKNGDIFKFLQEKLGISFIEAVQQLAREAGVDLPKPDQCQVADEKKVRNLHEVVELTCRFYEDELKLSGGEACRAYIKKRGFLPETVKEFRLGFAPASRTALISHLKGKGVPIELMIEAGVVRQDDDKPPRDYFMGRLMIPMQDRTGRVLGFSARALSADQIPKYLNTAECEIFHKGHMLYNQHRAMKHSHSSGTVVAVEGHLDVVAAWQAGFLPVVGVMGTAITERHMDMLWHMAPEPVIFLDGDKAGKLAAERLVNNALPKLKPGYSFTFAFPTSGKDADEVVQAGGREALVAEIGKGVPLVDILWRRETDAAKIDTPERRAALEKRFDDLIGTIADLAVRKAYRTAIRSRLSSLFWQASRPQGGEKRMDKPTISAALDAMESAKERLLLGLAVEYPELIDQYGDRLSNVRITKPHLDAFRNELLRLAWSEKPDLSAIGDAFAPALREVHGEEEKDEAGQVIRPRGHAVRAMLPLLRYSPSPVYGGQVFEHTLTSLEIAAAEAEIAEEASGQIDEATERRIMALISDLRDRRSATDELLKTLTEDGRKLRAAIGEN